MQSPKREKYKIKKIGPYLLLKEIGSGQSATVYMAKIQENILKDGEIIKNYRKVAIKMIQVSRMTEERLKRVQQEIDILRKLEHKNIVRILDYKKSENNWYLVFEYCHHGDLNHFIKSNFEGKLTEKMAQQVIQQIAPALQLMQKMNIVHRDLKLDNILVDQYFQIKIGDFGFANIIENQELMRSQLGTPITMYLLSHLYFIQNRGPEILDGQSYNEKCDIWSIGIIIYQMIFGQPPFLSKGKGLQGLKEDIKRGQINFELDLRIKPSEQIKDLIRKMLVYNPEKRMNFEQFFNHPWVSGAFQLDQQQKNDHDLSVSLKQGIDIKNQIFNPFCNVLSLLPTFQPQLNKVPGQNRQIKRQQVKGKYEAILMMKISFSLQLFLEKQIVGFLAKSNKILPLVFNQEITKQQSGIQKQVVTCLTLAQTLVSYRLQKFLSSKLLLEYNDIKIILDGYQQFVGYFLQNGENDINNFALILKKKLKDFKIVVMQQLQNIDYQQELSAEYNLMQNLLVLASQLSQQESGNTCEEFKILQSLSQIYLHLKLPSHYFNLQVGSQQFDKKQINEILNEFSCGKFKTMTKFLKNPKLYEEFKNYEEVFDVKISNIPEDKSNDQIEFDEIANSLMDLCHQKF